MKVEFKVHGVSQGSAHATAQVDGETVQSTTPCLEVELVSAKDRDGNLTLRFVGSKIEEAKAMFKPDAVIEAEFVVKQ
jgi:hypothetical protein